ncbi:hypothetical protein DQ824_11570 [Salmonella enterica subsp. enterica serovar Newport]|nr:hypothetical protein [Salmonella enterica subsp. enterica serovar Newport]
MAEGARLESVYTATYRGSTTGAASWTDDELARRLPEGRAQRVNPPLTAIFKKELVRMYGLFFT